MKLKMLFVLISSGLVLLSNAQDAAEVKDSKGKKAAVAKVDTADSLIDEVATEFESMMKVLKETKDKAGAEAAAKKINEVGDNLVALSKRADAIDEPSDAKKKELEDKMKKRMAVIEKDMGPTMQGVMADPEMGKIIMGAMMGFGEKMKKAEAGFRKLGKDHSAEAAKPVEPSKVAE